MKVGFIGLGRMGQVMAARLLDAGHDLAVYNRTADKTAELAGRGAKVMGSAAECARYGGVVITMLANDAALDEVSRGEGGLIASLPRGGIHVAMGTHALGVVKALEKAHGDAGQVLISAPMLGRPEVVAAGKAGVIAAGPSEAMATVAPLFEAIGRRTFVAGTDPGAGAAVKIANNLLLGCAIEAMGEAFALVRKSGGEAALFYDVIADGLFSSPAYTIYGKIIADEAYEKAGFTTQLALKDANLALSAGEAVGVPLPSGAVWRDHLIAAIAHGAGEKDWSSVALESARAAGLA